MAVDSLSQDIGTLYTSTADAVLGETVNNVFYKTPIWAWFSANGRIKEQIGGKVIEFPIQYAENTSVGAVAKGATLSIEDNEFLRPARYDWTYIATLVVRYFGDEQKNSGASQRIDWVQAKVENMRMSFAKEMERILCATGGGDEPWGLAGVISTTPTSNPTVNGVSTSIGGISVSSYGWWQNKQRTLTGDADVYYKEDLRTLYNNCTYFGTTPDVGICDQGSHELLESVTEEQKLIVNQKVGDMVFPSVQFRGMPIFWSTEAPSGELRLLTTQHLKIVVDPRYMIKTLPWRILPQSVNDQVAPTILAACICPTNRRTQGVLSSIA